MNDQSLEIREGDILGMYPDGTVGKMDPAASGCEQTFIGIATAGSVSMKAAVYYDKSLLQRMKDMLGPDCRVCGKTEFNHGMFPRDPGYHPHCKDNLEYLAWKYESKRLHK